MESDDSQIIVIGMIPATVVTTDKTRISRSWDQRVDLGATPSRTSLPSEDNFLNLPSKAPDHD